jgi:hypothetical protein
MRGLQLANPSTPEIQVPLWNIFAYLCWFKIKKYMRIKVKYVHIKCSKQNYLSSVFGAIRVSVKHPIVLPKHFKSFYYKEYVCASYCKNNNYVFILL